MHFAHSFDGAKPQDSASDSVIFTNLDRPRLFYGKTVHQPGKLLPGERFHLTGIAGPLEPTGVPVQAFVQQTKSVPLVVKRLDPVTPASTEQKQAV